MAVIRIALNSQWSVTVRFLPGCALIKLNDQSARQRSISLLKSLRLVALSPQLNVSSCSCNPNEESLPMAEMQKKTFRDSKVYGTQ